MNIRFINEDYVPSATAASSAEPFHRPDHKAKKRPRPANKYHQRRREAGERVGAGYFVFRRNENGRVHPSNFPFEHRNAEAARAEAERLHAKDAGTYEVYARELVVPAAAEDDGWIAWNAPTYECKPPVAPETMVLVKMRNGAESKIPMRADDWIWRDYGGIGVVVAYRVPA